MDTRSRNLTPELSTAYFSSGMNGILWYNDAMITDAQRSMLAEYFSTQPVDAVYLFGSQATGTSRADSDLDLGVLFAAGIDRSRRFDLRLEFMSEAGKMTGHPDQVDVVDLEHAPIPLRFAAIYPRQEVVVRDRNRRTLFEADTMTRYFDEVYYVRENTEVSLASFARGGRKHGRH